MVSYYAADFSPDNSKLYITEVKANGAQVCQFDLSNPDRDSIRNSKFPMGPCGLTTDIRLAPDGKLYFARNRGANMYSHGNRALASIENPNAKGALAQYKDTAILLDTLTGIMIGLPNVVVVENRPEALTRVRMDTIVCPWFTSIILTTPEESNNHLWSTGASDTAISITQDGVYYVSYTDSFTCPRTDTFKIEERDFPQYRVSLDTMVCPRFSLILTTSDSSTQHVWNTGASDSVISITQAGMYYVTYTDPSTCSRVDTFKVEQQDFPQWGITVDKNVLGVTRAFESYQWFKDSVAIQEEQDSTFVVSENGLYGVAVGYGICMDTLFYYVNNVSVPDLSASGLRVYPNPASGLVYIDAEAPVRVKLYDMGGRAVLAAEDVRLINIAGLPQGTYFLQVHETESGLYHRRMVIKSE